MLSNEHEPGVSSVQTSCAARKTGVAALGKPEEGAADEENQDQSKEADDLGERDEDHAKDGIPADLFEARTNSIWPTDDPVRVTMANVLRAKLGGCIVADSPPPPPIAEMLMCGRLTSN